MPTLVCFHAHPDDEALTTRGTRAAHAAAPHTSVTLDTRPPGADGSATPPHLPLAPVLLLTGYPVCRRARYFGKTTPL